MQKQSFSVKRVAVGVLVGFVTVTAFAGVGRVAQTNVLSDLFSRLLATENCYYDMNGDYVCDEGGNYYDGEEGCWYDMSGAYVCDDYDSTYDSTYEVNCETYGMDWFPDGNGGCYQDTSIWQCDDGYHYDSYTQSCYPDDYYGTCGDGSYWDDSTQACQPVDGSHPWEDCASDEYYDYSTESCQPADDAYTYCEGDYYWDDTYNGCVPNDSSSIDCKYDCNGDYVCEGAYTYDNCETDEYDSSYCGDGCSWATDHCECEAGYCPDTCSWVGESTTDGFCTCPWDGDYDCYDSAGNYTCTDGSFDDHDCYDSAGNWNCGDESEGGYDYNEGYWEYDEEWFEDELENMADMIEDMAERLEEFDERKEEIEDDIMDDIEDRIGDWEEDYEDDFDKLTDNQKDLYEDAIDHAEYVLGKVGEIPAKFDGLREDMEQALEDMEEAYEDFVESDNKDGSAFWDAQNSSGSDWQDIYWQEADIYRMSLHFYEFLIESARIEAESGMSAEEIGGEFAEQVGLAEDAVEGVVDAIENGLQDAIATAEAEIADGEDPWRAIDDVRDYIEDTFWDGYFDDTDDMWDSMEEGWEKVHEGEMMEFKEKELEWLREDLEWVAEDLAGLDAEGYDTTELRELLDKSWELLDELEAAEDWDDMDDLFEELDDIGREAERILEDMGLEGFGVDKRHVYAETVDVNDPDALIDLLSSVPEAVLEQVIEMMLSNVTTTQIEEFIDYSDKYGDIGYFDSTINATDDEEAFADLLDSKLALLGELDSKIADLENQLGMLEDKLFEVQEMILSHNYIGESAEEAQELISEMEEAIENATTDEEKEEELDYYKEAFEDLQEDSKKEKFELGYIPFMDTDDNQWYTAYVEGAVDEGIVGGYKDEIGQLTGYFGPGNDVTTGEILKIAFGTADTDVEGDPSNPYAKDHWSSEHFAMAEDMGFSITEDMMKNPDESATRGEVIKTMFDALGTDIPDTDDTDFADVDGSHKYADAIQYAKDLGIVSGDDATGNFRPDDSVNRAETAKIVDQFLDAVDLSSVNPIPTP